MPGGRPTKFTPEHTTKLLQAVRQGNYRNVACAYAGVSHQTLRNWIKIAQEPDAPPEYIEFLDALEKAEAEAEITDIGIIRHAARNGNWQAAAWVRERKNPERWGRRDATKVELTGSDGGPVDVRVALGVDAGSIAGLAELLAVRAAEAGRELGEGVPEFVVGEVLEVEAVEREA